MISGIYNLSGVPQYLLFVQSNESEFVSQIGQFTTDVHNALQIVLSF